MIHIASCTDRNYVMPTATMMVSACENNADSDITFHIVSDGSVSDKEKEKLCTVVRRYKGKEIAFYDIGENAFESFPGIGRYFNHITQAAYYRLMLPSILPLGLHKVLYLDGDIIIHDTLASLWKIELDNYPLATVRDMYENDVERYTRLDYPPSLGYFNSGVLLLNLDCWRKDSLSKICMDFMHHHADRIKFHDQDVLNCVFRETKMMLPLKYNVQNAFFYRKKEDIGIDVQRYEDELTEATEHPVIVHFTLSQKPWIIGCPHPYAKEFNRYRNMTPWRHHSIIDTIRYSGWRHTIGYYARKWGFISPIDNPYMC